MKSQTRKWEVAIKTMYIPWGSLALPKPQAFLGTKFTASSCQGKRLALYPARVMNSLSSVFCLRFPDTVDTLTFGWSHGSLMCVSLPPGLYSTNMPSSEIVSSLVTGFPTFPRFCSTFPNFFSSCDFNEINRINGSFVNLSL